MELTFQSLTYRIETLNQSSTFNSAAGSVTRATFVALNDETSRSTTPSSIRQWKYGMTTPVQRRYAVTLRRASIVCDAVKSAVR